ncbi:MAG: PaaI family thioesterase [Candidatus Hydrogenedentes bacterium]|nr:PaaI family thioesterase [Candidatus Hydrogenedentota bacterium]
MKHKHPHRTYLPNSKTCFVCGEDNPAGLQTRFYVEDGMVKTILKAQHHHCGYRNVVHGGVVAAILDECMGWAAARVIGYMCVTGDLNIRYLRPVPGDQELVVCTEVVRSSKRMVHAKGNLVGHDGTEYARGEGRFLPLSAEETLNVDDNLLYRGGEERVFDPLRNQ